MATVNGFNGDAVSRNHVAQNMVTVNGFKGNAVPPNDDKSYVAQNMVMKRYVTMAVQAVIELRIPDILANAKQSKALSAEEILQQLPTKSTPGPTSVMNLQRLLAPLVREGFFSESLDGDQHSLYGLTDVSKWFIRQTELSLAPATGLVFSPLMVASEPFVHEAILDETTCGFQKAHGIPAYEHPDPEYASVVQHAMESMSDVFFRGTLKTLLQASVLDGVETLVDVGGCRGQFVAHIVAHKPHIQGINFDLQHVIGASPAINGVKHVAGSFFDSVPSGDAMFLKWVLHNYPDEQAILILKNCFNALPKNGKVIVAEFLYDKHDKSAQAAFVECLDMMMLANLKGAQERSKEQYQTILRAAGFSRSKLVYSPGSFTLIVGLKE